MCKEIKPANSSKASNVKKSTVVSYDQMRGAIKRISDTRKGSWKLMGRRAVGVLDSRKGERDERPSAVRQLLPVRWAGNVVWGVSKLLGIARPGRRWAPGRHPVDNLAKKRKGKMRRTKRGVPGGS